MSALEKTRIGQEVFKIVTEVAPSSNALYVPMKLGNGQGFDERFDPYVIPSETLGARIVKGYFDATALKTVSTSDVLDVIAGEGEERQRPIVVHIDEHSQYAREYAQYLKRSNGRECDENENFIERGRQKLVDMVDELVGIATNIVTEQRLTLVLVLSGTPFGDV